MDYPDNGTGECANYQNWESWSYINRFNIEFINIGLNMTQWEIHALQQERDILLKQVNNLEKQVVQMERLNSRLKTYTVRLMLEINNRNNLKWYIRLHNFITGGCKI